MKLSEKIKKYKRIAAGVVMLFLIVAIEIGFNYPSMKAGYEWSEISDTVKIEDVEGQKYYVVSFTPTEECYIKQMRIKGQFIKNAVCYIETVERNGFGKLEEHIYEDSISDWFSEISTNLDVTVTELRVKVPVDSLTEEPTVEVSNIFEFNKYRMIFFGTVFILLYSIIFEPFFRKKLEWYFVLYALLFGSLIILYTQPQVSCWDEKIHFATTYRIASGPVIEWNEAAELISKGVSPKCDTKAEYALLRFVMNEKGKNTIAVTTQERPLVTFSQLAYIPSALFLKVGILLRLPFTMQFMLGKFGTLLTYIVVMFWAIRLAKCRKLFLVFISMMPTSIFIASAYTYDCVGFSFITLAGVLWTNEFFTEKKEYRKKPVILSLILFIVGCSAKIIYMPLALVLLLLPQLKIKNRKVKIGLNVSIVTICVLVMLTFLGPLLLDLLNGRLIFGDARGGATSMAGQLVSMQQNIVHSIQMFIEQIFSLDNFRNGGTPATDDFFVGNLLFLNYHNLGVMADKWCLLLLPVLTILLLYRDEDTESGTAMRTVKKSQVLFAAGLIGLVVVLIWLSMYLAFTPVGEDQILGVQPRYYLPLLYLAAVLIQNKNIFVQMPKKTVIRLSLSVALIFETVSIFDFLLKNRLF